MQPSPASAGGNCWRVLMGPASWQFFEVLGAGCPPASWDQQAGCLESSKRQSTCRPGRQVWRLLALQELWSCCTGLKPKLVALQEALRSWALLKLVVLQELWSCAGLQLGGMLKPGCWAALKLGTLQDLQAALEPAVLQDLRSGAMPKLVALQLLLRAAPTLVALGEQESRAVDSAAVELLLPTRSPTLQDLLRTSPPQLISIAALQGMRHNSSPLAALAECGAEAVAVQAPI
mmetsp:Transcript_60046/g.106634  ORF Transcript_60046/g.106634 Transcript_60046/m.106634 type:complete len:233 (+) Transcript_60046:66-764(+)